MKGGAAIFQRQLLEIKISGRVKDIPVPATQAQSAALGRHTEHWCPRGRWPGHPRPALGTEH